MPGPIATDDEKNNYKKHPDRLPMAAPRPSDRRGEATVMLGLYSFNGVWLPAHSERWLAMLLALAVLVIVVRLLAPLGAADERKAK